MAATLSNAALVAAWAFPVLAAAGAATEAGPEFKLTVGRYASSDGNPATDLNLRGSTGATTAWLGFYQDRAGLRQWRTGLEWRASETLWRSLLSLQNASGGAWVGAASAELGGDSYAILGWGRTNTRNYINLNYDPNDAVTWGVGTRALVGTELSLFQVFDDRLHTGQRVTHAVARRRFEGDQRLTVDVFHKRGLTGDGQFVRGNSWSIGYDRGALFVRFTHDPAAGFNPATQDRLALGVRW
jgi:hypothetical protein